ncbi:MAG: PEP-CTERM sorting domain-containing protein [Phycisphaerae bacterium]|nr:PEP-CTERM sorting domain-containing protein [Phycisphaerae bacterium]
MRGLIVSSLVLAAGLGVSSAFAQTVVLSTDFNGALPSAIAPGVATLTGVQFYAGLGPVGNQFGGSFLRSPTGNTITVTLTNLPAHTGISIDFLFAAIDSLDGTGSNPPLGDFFKVTLDGAPIFRESFANATADQIQSYAPAPGVLLARRIDLGFSGPGSYYTDSAYNMANEPRFHNIAHTASSVTISFLMEGPGIQPLDDESWAMDNLRITVLGTGTCPADFNHDGFVEDADFTLFVSAYNILECADLAMSSGCPADLNGDGFVDDADFTLFVVAYNELVCP